MTLPLLSEPLDYIALLSTVSGEIRGQYGIKTLEQWGQFFDL
jgi:hypothetical protein